MLGEPLPIELANATYAVRHRLRDGLQTAEHLAAWLRDAGSRLPITLSPADSQSVTDADLALARELRGTIRTLAAATVEGRPLGRESVAALNRCARETPRWRELSLDPEPHVEVRHSGNPVAALLAELAEQAIELFTSPRRHDLRACPGPGCVLFFVREDSRREWCSAGCGNRARAARHYAKVRRQI